MATVLKFLSYVLCIFLGGILCAIGYEPTRMVIESVIERIRSRKSKKIKLSGTWYAAWQTRVEGKEVLNTELIEIEQKGNRVTILNKEKSPENKLGGYLWRGECRIYDNEHIIGYYLPVEDNVVSKGTIYFLLNRVGGFMVGKWVGCNYDYAFTWGYGVIAKDKNFAKQKLENLISIKQGLVNAQENRNE